MQEQDTMQRHRRVLGLMDRSLRVDRTSGIREQAEFFEVDGQRLFGLQTMPAGEGYRGAVVICSPFLAQFITHYRAETLLARHLAEAGFAVQRFHYRGSGNSTGDPAESDIPMAVEDTLAATERLLAETGPIPLIFVGASYGGYVAGQASARYNAPLVLKSPPADGKRYFKEAFRSHIIGSMSEVGEVASTTGELTAQLDETGRVALLGYWLYRTFYEDARGRSLLEEIGEAPRPVLLIDANPERKLSTPLAKATAALEERGFPVDTHALGKKDVLWFVESRVSAPEDVPETAEFLETVRRWTDRQLGAGAPGGESR